MSGVRVVQHADGHVTVIRPIDGVDFDAECARVMDSDPRWKGQPFLDTDSDALPPRKGPCPDPGCTDEHAIREQWTVTGSGRARSVKHDQSLPNLSAEIAHAIKRAEAEENKDIPDASLALRHRRDMRRLLEVEGRPRPEIVAAIAAVKARR